MAVQFAKVDEVPAAVNFLQATQPWPEALLRSGLDRSAVGLRHTALTLRVNAVWLVFKINITTDNAFLKARESQV